MGASGDLVAFPPPASPATSPGCAAKAASSASRSLVAAADSSSIWIIDRLTAVGTAMAATLPPHAGGGGAE